MKITYLAGSIIPARTANSIQVMKMCQALASHGHEVILIYPDLGAEMKATVSDIYKFYDVNPVFEMVKVPLRNIKGQAYWYGLGAARLVKKINPDLIYGRSLTACYFAARSMKIPIGIEVHKPLDQSGWINKRMFKGLLYSPSFKRIVATTSSLKEYYLQHYPLSEALIYIAPNGADDPGYFPQPQARAERLTVGYAGSFIKGKGWEIVLELSRRCDWADFYLCGGLPADAEDLSARLQHQSNLYYQGFIPQSAIEEFRQRCDVLVAPYQKVVHGYGSPDASPNFADWTSPIKVFEYMASGKAIICSDLPVLREVLVDKYNAILCAADNIEAWVEALQMLGNSPELRQTIANNARTDFLDNYTWYTRAQRILKQMV